MSDELDKYVEERLEAERNTKIAKRKEESNFKKTETKMYVTEEVLEIGTEEILRQLELGKIPQIIQPTATSENTKSRLTMRKYSKLCAAHNV